MNICLDCLEPGVSSMSTVMCGVFLSLGLKLCFWFLNNEEFDNIGKQYLNQQTKIVVNNCFSGFKLYTNNLHLVQRLIADTSYRSQSPV